MGGFGEDDISVDETGAGGRESFLPERRVGRRMRALTMFDNIRATMYSTMAAMMEAGVDVPTAAAILSEEYSNQNMEDASASVRMFFEALPLILEEEKDRQEAAARIGSVALRAFGEKFVGPEEMSLLKALAVTKSPEKLFLACARLIAQYERERAAGAVAAYRRAAG